MQNSPSYISVLMLPTGSLLWLLFPDFQKLSSESKDKQQTLWPLLIKVNNCIIIHQINETCRYCSIVFCMYVVIFTFCSSLPHACFSLFVLQGNVCSDCLYGCCCYPLSWLQISRELKRRAASHASSSASSARYTLLDSHQGAHLV